MAPVIVDRRPVYKKTVDALIEKHLSAYMRGDIRGDFMETAMKAVEEGLPIHYGNTRVHQASMRSAVEYAEAMIEDVAFREGLE